VALGGGARGGSKVARVNGAPVRVGVLGCGTVGSALIQLLERQASTIEARTGLRLEVTRVAVRDPGADRGVALAPGVLTDDAAGVVADPDVDVVVEVMGGIEPALSLQLEAIKAGKPVVTANKELLASRGAEVFAAAEVAGVDVLFEAAVAGGIPLVRPLRESLLAEPVERILGIVNGTTNYVLTRMTEVGTSYEDALIEAQRLGYAEADPTADVEGGDASAKIAILASIAFGAAIVADDVYREGISGLTASDIAYATRRGYVVKLLAIAEQAGDPDGQVAGTTIDVRVHPALIPDTHPLAAVRDSFNAVFIQGGAVGDLMFYGRGAGGDATASAVLGDLVDAAINLRGGAHATLGVLRPAAIRPIAELETAYYLSLEAADRPGVLATIAGVFATHGVSIASMEQELPGEGWAPASGARIVFVTHTARERDVQATLAALRQLDAVEHLGCLVRVLDADEPTP
jgi:homoserine dehydrogenase